MITADRLTRMYGAFYAVRDVSFSIPRGQVAAFVGPNGAGKSTTMLMLTGLLAPTSGVARIAGVDVATDPIAAAERLGFLPENGPLYDDMNARSLLRFFGRARGLSGAKLSERLEAVVAQCRLEEVIGKPAGKLSKGYRQRLGLAQALLHDPDVLILDEPTAGLDPNQIDQVRRLLRELGKTKTILLSTHILSEVRAVAQRIVFINQGRIVHDGPTESLGGDQESMERRFLELTRGEAAIAGGAPA
ncbi:MAG: ATP-binding cassette domain-containing protein [Phycisphaeraceae bacterium]|nr:ATP-binding cassette domain-containing protein [Phycisphaeraceae bacterium]